MPKLYHLTPQADADIEEIWYYTAHQWGNGQAEIYLQELHMTLTKLAEHTLTGKSCAALLLSRATKLRYYHINRHYVIYQPCNTGIDVLALFHDRMDLPRHLEDLQG